ncbi:MAG: hypothetical protein ACK47R_19775, partial [Planctomycetia bacterium]
FVTSTPATGTINLQGIQNYDGILGLNLKTTGASGNINVGQITTTTGGVSFTNSQKLSLLGNVSSSGAISQVAGTGGTPSVELGVVANGTTLSIQTTTSGSLIDIASPTILNQTTNLTAAGAGSIDLRSSVNSNTTTPR